MNIKTMTCHHVYNYGATLQAYALQTYLESQGHNVEIIDYRLPTHIRYELFMPYPKGRMYELIKKIPILKYIVCPYRNIKMLQTWGRKKAFDDFDKRFLHLSSVTYRNINEIRKNPPNADVYIAGSDQIWNTDALNGKDLGYYLDFGNKNIRRISYAASFGISKIKVGLEDFVARELRKFNKISVREKTGLDILKRLGLNGTLVVDPVFLLSKEQWLCNLNLKEKEGNYILLYDFLHDDVAIRNFALALSKKKKLKIVSVNDISEAPYADIQINNAGPIEFLQYLLNATYVVSNSFHATAFSLIFQKEFATFSLISQHNSTRMEDLLQCVGLEYRLNPVNIQIFRTVDWEKVSTTLLNLIVGSKNFLNTQI